MAQSCLTLTCNLLASFVLIHLSGVYFLHEIILPEIILLIISLGHFIIFCPVNVLYNCFNLTISIAYNLFEFYFDQLREISSFNSLMAVDKQSTNLAQFINRLLPLHIQDIINSGIKTGEIYSNVTLLYADIVGFTAYSTDKRPRQVVEMLSRLFTSFDKGCDRLNLFKIYTIGDCYVVMGFVDSNNRRSPREEAHAVAQLAISMINIIINVRKKIKFELNMRIGIHTGEVYGGVMGTDLVRFDLYGEDVVIANKMESGGKPGKIAVSEVTKNLLEDIETANYTFTENEEGCVKLTDRKVKSYFMNIDNYIVTADQNQLEGDVPPLVPAISVASPTNALQRQP
jgi:class 3 adenylate cyclase